MSLWAAAFLGGALLAIGSLALYGVLQANRRNQEMPAVAARAGLEYSSVDPFNSAGVPFPLFRLGIDRQVTNLMWRADRRTEGRSPTTRVFDFAYLERPDRDSPTGVWHTYTCALAQHNGGWPTIRVTREGMVARAFQKLGLPDIDFESEEFNRAFVVQCEDRRFASALIDPQMMTFLLSTGGELAFETRGRFLLISGDRVDATRLPGVLGVAEEFLRRVPPAVRELYPTFPDGAGTEVFPVPPVIERTPPGGLLGDSLLFGGFDETPSPFEFSPTSSRRDPDADPWDPTPGVDHDLDGHPLAPVEEDPWHDHPPHRPEP